MATADSETPPEPEGNAPDWTYEELIDTFVKDYSAGWLEWYRPRAIRGVISESSFNIIVERRNPPPEPTSTNLDIWAFWKLQDYRFWFLDKDGLEELSQSEYQEITAATAWIESSAYSSMTFCFEAGYRYMVVHHAASRGQVSTCKNRIGRDSDGKLCIMESILLGMS